MSRNVFQQSEPRAKDYLSYRNNGAISAVFGSAQSRKVGAMKKRALILGARSAIAMAMYLFAKNGYDIQLAARNPDSLSADKSDIELRYKVTVTWHDFDALNIESHENL